jgi:hypothetical protein
MKDTDVKRVSLLDVIKTDKRDIITRVTLVASLTQTLTQQTATKLSGSSLPEPQVHTRLGIFPTPTMQDLGNRACVTKEVERHS